MIRKISLLMLGVLLIAGSLNAGTTGKISGKVTDRETGEPLPGTNVIIVGTSLGAAAGVNGSFTILSVSPGIYALKAQFIGYRAVEIQNIRVTVDLTTSVNFEMPSQDIEGADVVIIAERPLIDPNATNEVHVKRAEDIEYMPIRGYQNIVATEAGVVQVGNNLYIRGSRAEEVAYYVDGVYINNAYTLARTGDVINNSIEEVSFQAGGFGAEYGSANGGVINTTTKSGSSELRISGEVFSDEFLSKENDNSFGTYSYGQNLANLAISGPLSSKIKFYVTGEFSNAADRNPTSAPHIMIDSIFYETVKTKYAMSQAHFDKFGVDSSTSIVLVPIEERVFVSEVFGPRPNNGIERVNFNGNLLFDLNPLRFRVGGSLTDFTRRNWSSARDLFNSENNSRTEGSTRTGYLNLTHSLSQNALYKIRLTYFRDETKNGDNRLWEDFENYGDLTDWNADGIFNTDLRINGQNQRTFDHFARYQASNAVFDDYSHTISSHIGLTGDIINQRGDHEVKIGGEIRRNNVQFYRLAQPMELSATFGNLDPDSIDQAVIERTFQSAYAENIGFNYRNSESGVLERDAARKPINAAIYLQDKVELEDMILNIGIRWDYLQPATDIFLRPDSIVIKDGKIADENLGDGVTHSFISPRIGLAFPVTDKTVFHAQYGKYFQQPELQRLFVSYVRFANNLQAGNFTISGNPELKPEQQTQYEVGFQQQIGQSASLDVTVYYRELKDYVQVQNQLNSAGTAYAIYVNGDYGTIKGTTFSFDLRRTSNVRASASYTFQTAAGTGSNSNSQFRQVWQDGFYPTYVSPLDFDQRHTGSVNFDYRLSAGEGPFFLQKTGINVLYTFGSGRRYTPVIPTSALFPGISQDPVAAVNSGTMPFFSQVDLRVNRLIDIGGATFDFYIWVRNLTNKQNVTNVYNGTGEADNDGYFSTSAGKTFVRNFPNGADIYSIRVNNPGNWRTPRQLFIGVKFNL